MGRCIIARHGETLWNKESRVQGWAPTELTERGRQQATELGQHVGKEFDIDVVVSSDLVRAMQTAEVAVDSMRSEVDIETDPRLREQDFGIYQGLPDEQYRELVSERHSQHPDDPMENGESVRDVRDRAVRAFRQAKQREELPLLVTHTGVLAQILGTVAGESPYDSYSAFEMGNCSVAVVEDIDGEETLTTVDRTSFLGEED